MIRFLISVLIYFLSALVGIIVADLLLDGFNVPWQGYLVVAAIFAVVQAVLSPLISNVVEKNARAFSGGVGIVSALIALVITNLISDDLTVSGAADWILAAIVIWVAGAIAAFILPFFLLKKAVRRAQA